MSKLLAGAYAVRAIENHIRDISAAAYPHCPQQVDAYYNCWLAHLENVKKILDGDLHK